MLRIPAPLGFATLGLAALIGCGTPGGQEDPSSWYGEPGDPNEDVTEPVAFTADPYDWAIEQGGVAGLDDLFEDFTRKYAPEDLPPDTQCDGWEQTSQLPTEFWAMVTVHPRYYFKTNGCDSQMDEGDSEEKYYGSFFIEDSTGGIFVLGDSKVAHFDMGDRVKIKVRGVARRFGLDMVVAHDIVEIERGPFPIHYVEADGLNVGEFEDGKIGDVIRVEGEVIDDPDTFGEFHIRADDGTEYTAALDAELNRRGVGYAIGTRLRATGPVQRAFGDKLIIMRIGQLEVL